MTNQILAVSIDELDTQEKHQKVRHLFKVLGAHGEGSLGIWGDRKDFNYTYLVKDLDGEILWWEDGDMNPTANILTFQELLYLAYPKAVTKDVRVSIDTSWYDYDNQKAVAFPPIGEQVLYLQSRHSDSWVSEYIVAKHHYLEDTYLISSEKNFGNIYYLDDLESIKPLDFDKNKGRDELIEIIASAGNLSIGILADIILNAGYKRTDN